MLPMPDRPEPSMLNTSFALSDATLGVSNDLAGEGEGGESHGCTGGPGARPGGPMPASASSRRSSVVSLASRRSSIADLWFSAEAERLHSGVSDEYDGRQPIHLSSLVRVEALTIFGVSKPFKWAAHFCS